MFTGSELVIVVGEWEAEKFNRPKHSDMSQVTIKYAKAIINSDVLTVKGK